MAKESFLKSRYSEKARLATEPGRPMHNEYQIRIDDNGHKTLHKTGETNLQDKIQASLESTLISTILEACQGDQAMLEEAVNQRVGKYIKLEELPQNLKEAQQAIIDIKNEFYTLPVEIRAQFDNSPERYVADYGTEGWINVLYPKKEEPKTEVKEEVKANE